MSSDRAELKMAAARPWWQSAIFYQIYPRSFQDTNGDGVGDLQGIIDRLDYLNDGTDRSLGIDAIWLSPTFPSPMADFGYDVSDYREVHPLFGDLATMDRLIAACHQRGIRLLLDYVPNHSSDQHPWFVESRRSRHNPRRDWYYWRDPAPGGGPPNNWVGVFGGSAWQWDGATEQYYLHSFLVEQPDLNWRNSEVVRAMQEVLRFWLRRGIDGFRIDVMGMLLKEPNLRDNPPNSSPVASARFPESAAQVWQHNRNWPEVFAVARDLRAVIDEFDGRMLVGEVSGPPATIAAYYGADGDGLNLAFNFALIGGYQDQPIAPWDAETFRAILDAGDASLPAGAWPCYAMGNHDRPRLASRYGNDEYSPLRARAAAVILLTLRGAPFLYYGDEIGMLDVQIPPEQEQDPARIYAEGRDPERTPMQWDHSEGAGFSTGAPWLPLGDRRINVAQQIQDPASLLSLYRRLIRLRRATPALQSGSYRSFAAPRDILVYERSLAASRLLMVVNFSHRTLSIDLAADSRTTSVLLSSRADRTQSRMAAGEFELAPFEACVLG